MTSSIVDTDGVKNKLPASAGTTVKEEKAAAITLKIDGVVRRVEPTQLLDPDFVDTFQKDCASAEHVYYRFTDLLTFNDQNRFVTLDFLASVSRCIPIVGGEEQPDLLTAALEAIVEPDDDMELCRRAKVLALEVAIMTVPDALDIACGRIQQKMKGLGYKGVKADRLVSDARQIMTELSKGAAKATAGGPRKVKALFPDAPVGDDVMVPARWRLSEKGVQGISDEGDAPGMVAPVILTERGVDVQRETQLVTVAWFADGHWHQRVIDRDVIASTRSIVDLAAFGVPVNSNNARTLVQYLAEFEAANCQALPVIQVARKLGWHGGAGNEVFLWGKRILDAKEGEETPEDADTASSSRSPSPVVRFRGADEGDEQVAAGLHGRGTMRGWLQSIEVLADYPKVQQTLYASFSAPLLKILDSPNYILSLAGQSTGGKTTTLRAGASVWGNPDETSPHRIVNTWDCTPVFRERTAAVLNNIPLFLDDTKKAKSNEDVARTIYDFTQGQGRGRGSVKGLACQDSWRSVLLMTGEQSATSFVPGDGGSRPRVLELWGEPFGTKDQETGQTVRKLNQGVLRHYGHAGPLFMHFLLRNLHSWQGWREAYQEYVNIFENWAGDNVIAGRMAVHFAALSVTGVLVHEALDLPWQFDNPINLLFDDLTQQTHEADRAAVALRYIMSWACAHQKEFWGRGSKEEHSPHSGWVGRWDQKGVPNPILADQEEDAKSNSEQQDLASEEIFLSFLPHHLDALLREGGFEPDATLRTWNDRAWLKQTQDGAKLRRQVKQKIGGASTWVVGIKRKGFEEVGAM